MGDRSQTTKDARRLEKLYGTKEHGTSHSTVHRLVSERGLEGAIQQLEAWGMKPAGASEGAGEGEKGG